MPSRRLRWIGLSVAMGLLTLSVATCRLDQLLKSSARAHPVLSVAPTDISDSARAGSDDIRHQNVVITNGGDGKFDWSATKDKGWISLSPSEGSVPDTLTISLDAHGMAPATYHGTVTIHAPGTDDSTVDVSVTFVVQRAGLNVSPSAVVHATNVNSNESFGDTLRISNNGNGILVWTASKSKPWITLGTIAGTGPGIVPITIKSGGLAAGTYTDEVVITAPGAEGSPARVDVTLNVFQPGLSVLPTSIHDSANIGETVPRIDSLVVGNSGGGTITWTATKSHPWVTLSRIAGAAPPSDTVVVMVNPTGLPSGTYRDTIVFRSPQAPEPRKIPVQLDIGRAVLSVKPSTISDAAMTGDINKRDHALAIINSGQGVLSWTATDDTTWISLSAPSGTGSDTITVTLDPSGLAPGTHKGNVIVTAPGALGSPEIVPVTFTIQAPCGVTPVDPDADVNGSLSVSDCISPQRAGSRADLYSVNADAGDTFSFRMTAPSLNSYLILTDAAGNVLAQNDQCPGEAKNACIKNFGFANGGQYIIQATSSSPGETGSYTLHVVRELPPPPPQGLGQFHKDGTTIIAIGGTTSEDGVRFKGTVSDPNDADSVRLEIEVEPLGSPFTNVRTNQSDFVPAANGNVVVSIQAGVSMNTSYHWQARSCDKTNRCSVWLKYGDNAETAADFGVVPPAPPPGGSSP